MDRRDVLGALRLEGGARWVDLARDWQMADALAVLEDERPYHWLGRPRGGSKTTDAAAVGLVWLLTAEPGARFYAAAGDKDQAGLLLGALERFVRRTPGFSDRVRIGAGKATAIETGATLIVMASDSATSWGILPDGIVLDELAWWPDGQDQRLLLDSLASAAAKVAGCRMIVITSPSTPGHFSHRIYEGARADPLWRVSEQVGSAPPWLDPRKVEEQRRRLMPSMFARLFEGRWADADDQLTTLEALRACVTHSEPLEYDRRGGRYVIALDLGVKRDRTAVVVAHRQEERVVLDRLAVWQGSRAQPVALDEVETWVQRASAEYGAAKLVADPWQAVGMCQRLRSAGVSVEEFAFSAQSVGRLASTLYGALRDQRLALPDDADLLDELLHVRLRETSPGVWRLDHDSGRHDDRAISLALATHHLLEKPAVAAPTAEQFARLWQPREPWHAALQGRAGGY